MQNLNYNLVQTATITSELGDLFQNTPRHCLKQNASGWSTNQRILFVKDKRLIYANHFKQFKQGVQLQIPQKYVKSFVNLQDIYEVNYLPVEKMQKKSLSILIPQKRINQQPIQSKLNNNPNTAGNSSLPAITQTKNDNHNNTNANNHKQQKIKFIKWVFHFAYDLKQKLQEIREIKKQEQRKMNLLYLQEKEEPQYHLEFAHKIDESDSQRNSPTKNMKKSYQEQISLHQYVNQIKKAKDYIKFKQNRQKMEKNQRRKNKPSQEKFQDYSPFSNDEKNFPIMNHWRLYFSAIQDLLQNKNPQKTIYQYELIVYKQVHNFKQACIGIFKNYIFEKLNAINGQKWKFGEFYFYKGIWIKLGGKELNQQFLMNYNVADLINLLNKNKKIPYRVPDICLIDYLGFKALCMCDLPFSEIEKSQVYSLYNETHDLQNISKIKDQLIVIQKALNLKNQDIQKANNKKVPAPLGDGLRIFEYHPKRDIKNDQSSLQHCYYLTNLQNIFPLDFNFQIQKPNLNCRFRPQLIGDIRQILQLDHDDNTQLLSTAFMISGMNQQLKTRQDDKVVKTSKFLLTQRIPQLVDKLNNCQLIIVDSYSLKMYMSEFGINMRYMYRIHQLAKINYIKQVIQIQCIARTIKAIFLDALRQFTSTIHNQRRIQKENQYNDFEIEKNQFHHQLLQQKFKQDQLKIVQNTIDFLNLVFGNSEESKAFWKILCERTQKKFSVKVAYPFKGSAGALLHAVLYNCGIEAVFDIEIPLFRAESPFSWSNEINLIPKTKTFDFPSFQIQKLIRSVPNIATNDLNKQLLESVALRLFKMDLLKNYYLFEGQNNYYLSFSKINLVKEEMQKSRHVNSHHPSQISYYISNKTQANFQKGLNLMAFCYSDFHPLYISFYEEYSKFYQPQLLKKTAILQSIKCFGEFHPQTSQMYSNAYQYGYKEFYQKSLRTQEVFSAKANIKGQFQAGKYFSCMEYCLKQMSMSQKNETRIKRQNSLDYLQILFIGMKGALQIRRLQQGLTISNAISDLLNKFKLRNYIYHYELVKLTLRMKLILMPEKLFLYKLALLCISTREKFNQKIRKNQLGRVVAAEGKEKEMLATGIMNEYFTHDTHALWLDNILKHLIASYQYFNHLDDLFNNFQYHMTRYNNEFFVESLGYWDILVRLYGEDMFRDYLYQTGNL